MYLEKCDRLCGFSTTYSRFIVIRIEKWYRHANRQTSFESLVDFLPYAQSVNKGSKGGTI